VSGKRMQVTLQCDMYGCSALTERRRVPRRWFDLEHAAFMDKVCGGASNAKSATRYDEGNSGFAEWNRTVVSSQLA